MRRTLLAVGLAVIVSMMLAPHGNKQNGVEGWGLFFSDYGLFMRTKWGDVRTAQCGYADIGRVMIDMMALQMVFLSVLFALIVNIHWPGNKKSAQSK
jgi:hypothetical protein